MVPAPSDLLSVVQRSPDAVAAHDKAAWVGLFTDDGRVEDPVGSRPHVGHEQIGRFYDTFIAPREIVFHRDVDVVSGTSVIRDLTLEVGMGPGVRMAIPAFLRYDLRPSENDWRIERLRAYWELPTMVAQLLRHGAKSLTPAMRLSAGLLRNQRLGGTVGFLSGFRGSARHGRRLVEEAMAEGRLGDVRNQTWHKVIGAGNTVAAAVTTSSGRGVLFADINRHTLSDVKVFCNDS